MSTRVETRLAGAAGLVGLALAVLGAALDGEFATPASDDAVATVEHFAATSADAAFVSGMMLETLGFVLLLALLAGVARAVVAGRGTTAWLGWVVLVAAVVATVLTLASIAAFGAAAFRSGSGGGSEAGILVLSDLRHLAYWVSLPVWAVLYLAAGSAMLQGRSFPTWFGVSALVIGALHLVVGFLPPEAWDPVTALGGLWMGVAAVLLLVSPARYPMSIPAGSSTAGATVSGRA